MEQQTDNQSFCEGFKSEQLIFNLLNKKWLWFPSQEGQ